MDAPVTTQAVCHRQLRQQEASLLLLLNCHLKLLMQQRCSKIGENAFLNGFEMVKEM
jgi:hypothetical protein